MSEKEASREQSAPASSSEESSPRSSHPGDEGLKSRADQYHSRQTELYKQSLAAEGETAYLRWGLPYFHSLSDEDAEAQWLALGVEPKDALDFYNKGCLLAANKDFDGAAKAFARAFQLDQDLSEALFNQALALENNGNKAAARETWLAYLAKYGEGEGAGEVEQHLSELAEV